MSFNKQVERILNDAVIYSRKRFPLKSANKIYLDKKMLMEYKKTKSYSLHTSKVDQFRVDNLTALRMLPDDEKESFINKRLELNKFCDLPSGNCEEMSKEAFNFLKLYSFHQIDRLYGRVTNIQLVEIVDKDHVFILIGNKSMFLPTNMSNYDDDVFVCDPWAKIVCLAVDFPREWKLKMLKWESRGLFVKQIESENVKYRSPMELYYAAEFGSKRIISFRQN